MLFGVLAWLLVPFFASTTIQSYICQPPAVPVIGEPTAHSTVDAGLVTISGGATAGSTVTIDDKGQAILQLTAANDNTFAGQASLAPGEHSLSVLSTSPCGNSAGNTSVLFHVVAAPHSLTNIPGSVTGNFFAASPGSPAATQVQPYSIASSVLTLQLTAPANGSRYTSQTTSVFVRGFTSLPATIHIAVNGQTKASTAIPATAFGLSVPVEVGSNAIKVTATAGTQTASSEVVIARFTSDTPTVPALVHSWYRTPLAIAVISIAAIGLLFLILRGLGIVAI